MSKHNAFDILSKHTYSLDLRNRKLLAELLKNARESFTKIGKVTNLSKETIQYRFHQLLKQNVILFTYPDIDFHALGFQKYHILLVLDERCQDKHKKFLEHIKNDSNTLRVIEFSDDWDFEITLLAKNIQDFDTIQRRLLDPFSSMILRKDTEAVIKVADMSHIPELGKLNPRYKTQKNTPPPKLDIQDRKILYSLAKDARLSTYKAAPFVGLSADAIGLRLKRLLTSGIIKRFTCHLNFSELEYLGFMFSFTTASLPKAAEDQFFTAMKTNRYILSVKKTLGSWDYKCYFVVKRLGEFHHIVKDLKREFPDFVQVYQTLVIYKEHYFNPCPEIIIKTKTE